MADIQIAKVEQHPSGRSVFSVRISASAGRLEFPIGVSDQGTATLNEAAVRRAALGLAEELAASLRRLLGS